MDRRRFSEFVAKIGAQRAAQRLGVSERTLKSWLTRGVPARQRIAVTATVERHFRAVHAATAARRWREGGWRDEITLPTGRKRGDRMTPEQLTPKRDPRSGRRAKRFRERLQRDLGSWTYSQSANWHLYSSPFQPIEQDYQVYASNLDAWGEDVVRLWRSQPEPRGRQLWFHLHLWRYYPDNPAYQGKPGLMSKAGTWQAVRPISKGPVGSENDAAKLPTEVVFTPNVLNRGGPREQVIGSINDDAESRNYWVVGYHIVTGFRREEISLEEVVTGREPRSPAGIIPRPRRRRRKK